MIEAIQRLVIAHRGFVAFNRVGLDLGVRVEHVWGPGENDESKERMGELGKMLQGDREDERRGYWWWWWWW